MITVLVFSGCGTAKRIGLAKLGMTTTTIELSEDKKKAEIVSKSDSKVTFTADANGITGATVDNQGRPGLPERLAESLVNRTSLVVGSGVDTIKQDSDD